MQPYDLIVIGSGPGGQRAAIQAAKAGKRVAVVERQTMVGGVCINAGTIPSTTMREAVLHLSGFYDQAFYGASYHPKENISMSDLSFRVNRVIENEAAVFAGSVSPQRNRSLSWRRHVHRFTSRSRGEHHWLQRTGKRVRGDSYRHSAGQHFACARQRPHDYQQRPDPDHANGPKDIGAPPCA